MAAFLKQVKFSSSSSSALNTKSDVELGSQINSRICSVHNSFRGRTVGRVGNGDDEILEYVLKLK